MADVSHMQSHMQSMHLGESRSKMDAYRTETSGESRSKMDPYRTETSGESRSKTDPYRIDMSGNNSIDSGIHVSYNSYEKKPQNGRYPHSSDSSDRHQDGGGFNASHSYPSHGLMLHKQPERANSSQSVSHSQDSKHNRGLLHQKSYSTQELYDKGYRRQRSVPEQPVYSKDNAKGQGQGHGQQVQGHVQQGQGHGPQGGCRRAISKSTEALVDGDETPSKPPSLASSESPVSDHSSSTCTEPPDPRNPYEDHIYSEIGSLTRTPLTFHSRTRRRLSWGREVHATEAKSSSASEEYASFLDRYPRLLELEYVPWGEQEVLNILREGRTKSFSGHITVEMMHRLSKLLHKPLVRISREAQRLSSTFRRCTRHDLQSAMKVVLARPLYESCVQACMKAVTLHAMGGGPIVRESKSQHCGLKLSVGRFHRWMQDARLAIRVQETAAIFLAACIENLLEEIVLRALGKEELGASVFAMSALEKGIESSAELWGLLQPYQHLVCGRDASGALSLPRLAHQSPAQAAGDSPSQPSGDEGSPSASSSGVSSADSLCSLSFGSSPDSTLESHGAGSRGGSPWNSLLATCVASVPELGTLVSEAMQFWQRGITVTSQRPAVTWGADALHVLYHYLQCSQVSPPAHPRLHQGELRFTSDRPSPIQAPLVEWVRVTVAHAEHRCALVVDGDDVLQAARLLLPDTQCPPRQFRPSSQCWQSTQQARSGQCGAQIQRDMAFTMLCTGRSDLLPQALALLGTHGVDACNDQGLTPLMCACLHGDEAMVQMLLDAGASVDKPVPTDSQKHPSLLPEFKHWTALGFATLLGHICIMQLLLERGAHVEGGTDPDVEEPQCQTPLQVAASAGHYELVHILLARGADPYATFVPQVSLSCGNTQRGHNAFTLAAMHGHRNVLRKLMSNPKSKSEDILSLEEILAEGNVNSPNSKGKQTPDVEEDKDTTDVTKHQYYNNHFFPGPLATDQHVYCNSHHGNNNNKDAEEEDDTYMTIDEAMVQSINKRNEELAENKSTVKHSREHSSLSTMSTISSSSSSSSSAAHGFSKSEYRVYQEAMYHAAENGFLDIALELRSVGISWSLHTWSQCLWAAHSLQRKAIVQCLLKDFLATSCHDDLNLTFVYDCLPLMCHIFRNSKNEVTGQQLANILSSLYGNQPIPPIPPLRGQAIARIDPVYVNNPEMSDIQFVINGKTFHGHKIILVNASSHMRALLEDAHRKSPADGSAVTKIEIHDVKFRVFEMMMKYLYNGGIDHTHTETKDMLELLKAAHVYELSALKRHCEILLSRRLHQDNCAAIYKHAKVYEAVELLSYCEAYMLQNLTRLLHASDTFRKLLYSYKMLNYDLVNGLLATLSQTLEDRLSCRTKGSTFV